MALINDLIRELRERANATQTDVAKELGMARSTYAALEDGREPKLGELEKVANLYSMAISDLIAGGGMKPEILQLTTEETQEALREVNPVLNANKLREVLLYVTNKIGAKANIGETVLYKILYFIDFDYYEKTGRSITGMRYVKLPRGPVPRQQSFLSVIDQMKADEDLEVVETKYFTFAQKKYLPLKTFGSLRATELTAKELAHIDWEIGRLSDLSATRISDFSHQDTPWIVAKDNEEINYQHVFYRTLITAVTEDEDDL